MEVLRYTLNYKRFDPKTKKIEEKTKKLMFTLWHNGHKIFQDLYGMSVNMALFNEFDNFEGKLSKEEEQNLTKKLFSNTRLQIALIAASYVTDDGKNDMFTADEVMDSDWLPHLLNDVEFIGKLIGMVQDCLPKSKEKKEPRKKGTKKQKKSK